MAKFALEDFLQHTDELATISPAVVELINKINASSTTREEIAKLVSIDEVLYANVFKIVNSAALGLVRRPQTVSEAIDIIGLNGLRNLVFIVAAKKVFVDLDLWYKSVFVAFSSQRIALRAGLNAQQTSDIYIAGLMQSMGALIFKVFYKKFYEEILQIKDTDLRKVREKEIFGISSDELAYEIVKSYGLPENIVNIIDNQSKDWNDPGFRVENAIIKLSTALGDLDKDDIETQSYIDDAINFTMLTKFGIADLNIDTEFLKALHQETNDFVRVKV